MNNTEIIDEIIKLGIAEVKIKLWEYNKDDFHKLKNKVYSKYKLAKPISSIEIIERYNELTHSWEIEENLFFQKLIRKRWVRSQSGVTVISLLTKFWWCPGKCVYCPTFE